MANIICGVLNCKVNKGPGYRFPHPHELPTVFESWMCLTGNPDLLKLDRMQVYRSIMICSDHFSTRGINNPNGAPLKYKRYVEPTRNLPEPLIDCPTATKASGTLDDPVSYSWYDGRPFPTINSAISIPVVPSFYTKLLIDPEKTTSEFVVGKTEKSPSATTDTALNENTEPSDVVLYNSTIQPRSSHARKEMEFKTSRMPSTNSGTLGDRSVHTTEVCVATVKDNKQLNRAEIVKGRPLHKCRTCLKEFPESQRVSLDASVTTTETVLKGILMLTALEDLVDWPENHICLTCYKSLKAALLFRRQIIFHQKTLKKAHLDKKKQKPTTEVIKESVFKSIKEESLDCDDDSRKDVFGEVINLDDDKMPDDVDSNKKTDENIKQVDSAKITCRICSLHYATRNTLLQHLKKRHGIDTPKSTIPKHSRLCPKCGKLFYNTNLWKHLKICNGLRTLFTCDFCHMRFRKESCFIRHQKIHNEERPFVCELCPNVAYSLRKSLIIHKRKVHKDQSYENEPLPLKTCEYCGKICSSNTTLQAHVRMHTGEKPFVCEVCGKAYTSSTQLGVHKHIHGEKKLCPHCGVLVYHHLFNKHMKIHTVSPGIRWKCPHCNIDMRLSSRNRHLWNRHHNKRATKPDSTERATKSPGEKN